MKLFMCVYSIKLQKYTCIILTICFSRSDKKQCVQGLGGVGRGVGKVEGTFREVNQTTLDETSDGHRNYALLKKGFVLH